MAKFLMISKARADRATYILYYNLIRLLPGQKFIILIGLRICESESHPDVTTQDLVQHPYP